jgi:hypothetical protein
VFKVIILRERVFLEGLAFKLSLVIVVIDRFSTLLCARLLQRITAEPERKS